MITESENTAFLDIRNHFKSALREHGLKGSITTVTSETPGHWDVKVTTPKADAPADIDGIVEFLSQYGEFSLYTWDSKTTQKSVIYTFQVGPYQEDSEEEDLDLPGTVRISPPEGVRASEFAMRLTAAGVDPSQFTGSPAEVAAAVADALMEAEGANAKIAAAEKAAFKADTEALKVNVHSSDAEKAQKIAELLAEKAACSGDKARQKKIRVKLRSLGYYLSRLEEPVVTAAAARILANAVNTAPAQGSSEEPKATPSTSESPVPIAEEEGLEGVEPANIQILPGGAMIFADPQSNLPFED